VVKKKNNESGCSWQPQKKSSVGEGEKRMGGGEIKGGVTETPSAGHVLREERAKNRVPQSGRRGSKIEQPK